MTTERIDIVVSERGSRVVKRNLEELAATSRATGTATDHLRTALHSLRPTADLNRLLEQTRMLRESLGRSAPMSEWPRRQFTDANVAIGETIRRLQTLRQSMGQAATGPSSQWPRRPFSEANQEILRVNRGIASLRMSMNASGPSSPWPRRPIADANTELNRAVDRLHVLRANMRDQTPWAATRSFQQGKLELDGILTRIDQINARMRAMGPRGPTSSLLIGPQQPYGGFRMSPLTDEVSGFNRVVSPATSNAHNLAGAVTAVGSAARGTHGPVSLLNRYMGALGSIAVAHRLMELADAGIVVRNRVNIISDSVEDANSSLAELYSVARRTRTSVEGLALVYQKAMMASQELGISQRDALRFVEVVGQSLAVQGSSAQTARGALIQLSQAIGTDIVRAEEFNSILEGAYPLALAAARGIAETGGSVARLRRMVILGKITSQQFFNAIMSQAPMMADMFVRTTPTISQAFVVLRDKMIQYMDTSEEVRRLSGLLANSIILVADNIGPLADVLFSFGAAMAVAFVGRRVAMVATMATNTGLLATALAGLRGVLGFMGGPIVGSLALLAGAGYWVYTNMETAADRVERLQNAMNASVEAFDQYNTMVQRAREEQAEFGGTISLTTEALLRQSRSQLQDHLATLQQEIGSMRSNIFDDGVIQNSNMTRAIQKLGGFFDHLREGGAGWTYYGNQFMEELGRSLEAVQNGTGSIDDFLAAWNRVRSAGPEISSAIRDLGIAMETLGPDLSAEPSAQAQRFLTEAEAQIARIAEAIGGFDAELATIRNATTLEDRVAAIQSLATTLELMERTSSALRSNDFSRVADIAAQLEAYNNALQLEQQILEGLGANATRLNELATESERFRTQMGGAAQASGDTEAALQDINFVPLNSGSNTFANNLVRAADAVDRIRRGGEIQLPQAPRIIEASYRPGADMVTRAGYNPGVMAFAAPGAPSTGDFSELADALRALNVTVSTSGTLSGANLNAAPGANGLASYDLLSSRDRTGQSEEYLSVLRSINEELNNRYNQLTLNNEVREQERIIEEATNRARQEGVILDQQDLHLIRERAIALQQLEQRLEFIREIGDAVFNSLDRELTSFVQNGTFNFKSFANSVIMDLSRIAQRMFILGPLQRLFGGFLGNLMGGIQLPGFYNGADFTVGGRGGVDQNVVAFKATRGERVQVTPAGKNAGGDQPVTVVFNISTPDVEGFRRSEPQMAARAQRMLARGQRNM